MNIGLNLKLARLNLLFLIISEITNYAYNLVKIHYEVLLITFILFLKAYFRSFKYYDLIP